LAILESSSHGPTLQDTPAAIRKLSLELYNQALSCYQQKIIPQLDKSRIHIIDYAKLSKTKRKQIDAYFKKVIYPILTPLALDSGHPFPRISNLRLNLAIVIQDSTGRDKFALLKIPDTLPRLVPLKLSRGGTRKDGTITHHHYFVWLEQVIAANLEDLFPGMEVIEISPFRIVRDADVKIQGIGDKDLLDTIQQSVLKRELGSVIQVSIYESMSKEIRALLLDNLPIRPNDIFVLSEPLGLADLSQLSDSADRFEKEI